MDYVLQSRTEIRDVYATGIKTIIAEVIDGFAKIVCDNIID